MRAFLFASATATTLNPRASLSRLAQMLRWSRLRSTLNKAERAKPLVVQIAVRLT